PDRERGCTHGDVRRQPARPAGARTAPPRSRARRALIHPGAVEHVSETMARDEVMQALEAAVAADVARGRGARAWLRGRSRGARLALLAAAAAAEILLVVAWSPRAGLDDSPAARLALTLGWASAIVLAASFHALRPLHRPPARRRIVAGILFVAVAAPIALAFLPDAHGAAAAPWYACLGKGVALAVPLLLLSRPLDRPAHARRASAALAAVCPGLTRVVGPGPHCTPVHATPVPCMHRY